MPEFNRAELIIFLRDEYLTKGGEPDTLDGATTYHRDVRERFSLSDNDYRELIAELKTLKLVRPEGLDAHNGFLVIKPAIVRAAQEAEGRMFEILLRTNGEDFTIHSADGSSTDIKGLRNGDGKDGHGRKYVGFLPGTKISTGDIIESKISGDRFQVVQTQIGVFMNKPNQVKAYYEAARSHQPTTTINVGQMHNSALMHNSPGATQTLTFTQTNKNDAAALVASIREALSTMQLDEVAKDDLLVQVQFAESQLNKPSPKPGIIRGTLEGIHEGLIEASKKGANAATVAAATGLAKQIWDWIQKAFT